MQVQMSQPRGISAGESSRCNHWGFNALLSYTWKGDRTHLPHWNKQPVTPRTRALEVLSDRQLRLLRGLRSGCFWGSSRRCLSLGIIRGLGRCRGGRSGPALLGGGRRCLRIFDWRGRSGLRILFHRRGCALSNSWLRYGVHRCSGFFFCGRRSSHGGGLHLRHAEAGCEAAM